MIFFPSVHSISKISLRIIAGPIFYKFYFVLILWVWKTRTKERCKMQLVRNDDQTFCYLKYTSTLAAHRIIRATKKKSLKIFWAFLQVKKEKQNPQLFDPKLFVFWYHLLVKMHVAHARWQQRRGRCPNCIREHNVSTSK